MAKTFDKILIANRGEIALRIHRACREMGIHTVAIHSTADADAMYVRLADESVCIGPPQSNKSYLNIAAILSAAAITRADAIHPGIGFMAENEKFAEMVEEHGFHFIGPKPEHIQLMGNKIKAKQHMTQIGLSVIPGSEDKVDTVSDALAIARDIGYPVLIKAVAGGGGRGIKIVHTSHDMEEMFPLAHKEVRTTFGDGSLYIEKYLHHPRHIEIQILADNYGTVLHFGERDCSIQRRHQKIIEETPSPCLNADQRSKISALATQAIQNLGYCSIGTLEFLYANDQFYFIEMNTRLQVEHPISEMITGIDLVREQIRLASGAPFGYRQEDIHFNGHAIECRIAAETEDFVPCPGRITGYHTPGGLGVRVDSALYDGYTIPPYYDSLISKLIIHGATRTECLLRLRRALEEYVIGGIETTLSLHKRLINEINFLDGDYDIHWLESLLAKK